MFDKLSAPFPPEAIHWRAQTVARNGDKALALAYIDARDVMDRLDAACGPENWQDSFTETAKGRLICTLSIRVGEEWISKSDGAGDTDVEGSKGAISDALKRAAVKWGIGRYLYDLGNVWAPCESYEVDDRGKKRWKWSKWANGAERTFADALNRLAGGTTDAPTGPINDKTRDWLSGLIDAAAIPVGEVCRQFQVTSLKALTYERIPDVRDWITANRKAA
jgi:hypothetical protein